LGCYPIIVQKALSFGADYTFAIRGTYLLKGAPSIS
jgi:hypothetical protein